MTDKLAGLVLPDATPVEELPEDQAGSGRRRAGAFRRAASRARGHGGADWLVAGCGIGLAAVCALFPWYIFLNQEEFGIRPLTLSREHTGYGAAGRIGQPDLVGAYVPLPMSGLPQLDFIPTGTVSDAPLFDEEDLPEQPFPGDRQAFRLLATANGRAMIEDEDGIWIVERGSALPDGSRVAQIVESDGTNVLITSDNVEIAISN